MRVLRLAIDGAVFVVLVMIWRWAIHSALPLPSLGAIAILGVVVLPAISWIGRCSLDHLPSSEHAKRIASAVHYGLMLPLGMAIVAAIRLGVAWPVWTLPVPEYVGVALIWITGVLLAITVINLAVLGLGAPFGIALSRRLATDWLYTKTRNPMVLATIVFLVALGLRIRSASFLAWSLLGAAPAWLSILKIYEERELEIRFGQPYLEYKRRTPMLLPKLGNPIDKFHGDRR
jgi:protein-S-isoprenylcysteine O-methyltransferase Ste14